MKDVIKVSHVDIPFPKLLMKIIDFDAKNEKKSFKNSLGNFP